MFISDLINIIVTLVVNLTIFLFGHCYSISFVFVLRSIIHIRPYPRLKK